MDFMSKKYTINFAKYGDITDIMSFIKENWSSTHILANCREFFEYQHCHNSQVTFLLARDGEHIKAALGFIPYDRNNDNIMLAIWKSIDKENPFLGVELLKYIIDYNKNGKVASVGINKKTIGIYNYLGYCTGELNHYYRIADQAEYKIADIKNKNIMEVNYKREYRLKVLDSFTQLCSVFKWEQYKELNCFPYKEPWYIEKRYYNHPVYHYCVYGIENKSGTVNSILIGREQQIEDAIILRLVDFLGDINDLAYISYDLQALIDDNGYEYIDFYQHGIPKEIMQNAGLVLKDSENIIPNYFEPFLKEDVPIYYFSMTNEHVLFFKGDCDQDRPNFFQRKNSNE